MNRKLIILLCSVLVSCNTSKNVVYIQDVVNGATKQIYLTNVVSVLIKVNGILSLKYTLSCLTQHYILKCTYIK